MAEFKEVMKQKERMCNSIIYEKGGCNKKCPLYAISNGGNCNAYLSNCPKHAEEIIMKWVEENPVQTNADKFKEVFGVETHCTLKGCILLKCQTEDCKKCKYKDFWEQEYKE